MNQAFSMERLCDLYFEFSNEDRLSILRKLEDDGMNVTGMARELGITPLSDPIHTKRGVYSDQKRAHTDDARNSEPRRLPTRPFTRVK